MSIKKLTVLAFYTTLSLAIFAVESAIPPLLPIPGIKLGLANIITLVLLCDFTPKDALLVLLSRILLSTLLFGQMMSFLYSLIGGLFSLLMMIVIHRILSKKFLPITSIMGGISHNLGQILIALLLTRTIGILAYLPFLILSGILTGLFTGLCVFFLQKYLRLRR